ncbi:unnamed protein product, partial [Rotaria sp. Silwood1]
SSHQSALSSLLSSHSIKATGKDDKLLKIDEAKILRNGQQFHELNAGHDRFITLLPIEFSSENI